MASKPSQNSASKTIRKAVIPVAGLGTRMLPLTKAIPKELLPVGNKPLIQHAVEEAAYSGIEEVILVAAPGTSLIQEHFRRNLELERVLEERRRQAEAEQLRALARLAKLQVVYQHQPLGLGHAIACARDVIGGEAFAVILPDALIISSRPCVRQLLDCYERVPGCYVATREVEISDLGRLWYPPGFPSRRFGMGRVTISRQRISRKTGARVCPLAFWRVREVSL